MKKNQSDQKYSMSQQIQNQLYSNSHIRARNPKVFASVALPEWKIQLQIIKSAAEELNQLSCQDDDELDSIDSY